MRVPVPQVVLHALHAPGAQPKPEHGVVLHTRVASGRAPVQSASDTAAPLELVHVTLRACVPEPHVTLHVEYGPATHA